MNRIDAPGSIPPSEGMFLATPRYDIFGNIEGGTYVFHLFVKVRGKRIDDAT